MSQNQKEGPVIKADKLDLILSTKSKRSWNRRACDITVAIQGTREMRLKKPIGHDF